MTDEELGKFLAATERADPMDRMGPVEAEEADTYRRCVRLRFMAVDAREPTDDELYYHELAVFLFRGSSQRGLSIMAPSGSA